MKLATWNINGLRSGEEHFMNFIDTYNADIVGLQEVKAHPDDLSFTLKLLPGYRSEFNWCQFNFGYSGTAFFIRDSLNFNDLVTKLGNESIDEQGRFIAVRSDSTTLINCYFPLGIGEGKEEYKILFCNLLYEFILNEKNSGKKLFLMGDLNIATDERDVHSPEKMKNHPIFAAHFREWLEKMKKLGLRDSFRHLNDSVSYSWYPYTDPARVGTTGMRIDYIFIDESLVSGIQDSKILKDVYGSDHCPLITTLDIS